MMSSFPFFITMENKKRIVKVFKNMYAIANKEK